MRRRITGEGSSCSLGSTIDERERRTARLLRRLPLDALS
jgi:hypothetical protein